MNIYIVKEALEKEAISKQKALESVLSSVRHRIEKNPALAEVNPTVMLKGIQANLKRSGKTPITLRPKTPSHADMREALRRISEQYPNTRKILQITQPVKNTLPTLTGPIGEANLAQVLEKLVRSAKRAEIQALKRPIT